MQLFEHINKKAAIGFAAALLLLFGFFFYWMGSGYEDDDVIAVLPVSPLDASLGRDLLAALAKLKSTELDTTIFSDPIFSSLRDFGVEIASQPIGRRNPFATFDGTKSTGSSTKKPAAGGAAKPSTSKPPAGSDGFDID